ncbi:uncharacterized protein LOC123546023 [Mercenaria mercenaria]|uniref:uncharacterized protein LOC123546023 n=1 Tax=Mercenaria mercenaria TaxID=6596 RepID=UPI00234EC057|nr:uncharacterized protein LOC123546023 [Mercenaria mercenaria]
MNSTYNYDSSADVLSNSSLFDRFYEDILNSFKTFYDAVEDIIYDTVESVIEDTFDKVFNVKVANWWKTAMIIILIESCIGVIGNILSLIIWNIGKRSSKMACSTYFKILAVSDILTIISGIVTLILPHFLDIMETNYCAVFGIVENILLPLAPQLSAWIIVSISIDRMLSLCFPFRFQRQGSKRRAWVAFFAITILLVGLNSNMFLCSNFVTDDEMGIVLCTCVGSSTGELEEVSLVWFLCILPFTAVAFCNIVIVVRLCLMRRSSAQQSSSNRQNRLRQFTKLCLGAAILHCVSVMPLSMTMYYFENMFSFDNDEMDFENLSDIDNTLTFYAALFPMCVALFFLNNL